MGATSTNPLLISLINMTIVFGVLAVLWLVMKIIYLVDPTKNKVAVQKKNKNLAPAAVTTAASAAALAASAAQKKVEEEKLVAAIAASIAASEADDEIMAALAAVIIHKQQMEPMQLPHHFFEN